MVRMVAGMVLAAGTLLMAQGRVARPGTVNYAEGQVSLNGQAVGANQIGQAEAAPGQVLETQNGKAEMLLTPGVFLRLSDQSAVRMVSPSLTDTRVELLKGEAMVEASQVEKENHLVVLDGGASTLIEKPGVYEFRADLPRVSVFDGKVEVQQNDRNTEVGKGKELLLSQTKPEKFDRDTAEASDSLYGWSKLRSEYTAEANMSTAQMFVVGTPGWYGTGWYWNPYFDSWAFMPGDGFLYSPFGWGFYSPAYWRTWGGYYGFRGAIRPGFRGGYVGHGFVGRPAAVAPRMSGPAMHVGGGFAGGGHFGGGRR
jgi:hypothetical protein